MRSVAFVSLLAALAAVLSSPALAANAQLQRFAVLVGTNDGGTDRVKLRYAASDAQSVSRVLSELGGVAAADQIRLEEATVDSFRKALADAKARLEKARRTGARTELFLYYSGHSDDEGLLLRGDRLGYDELRQLIEGLDADVRVAILDSCASGAFARRKGGTHKPAFLADASSKVKGQAILTSSSATEASQESDRIGGSYFTHHLVSGLRGAADLSRDGRVTLNEAYQFAFHETLARTQKTKAGAQHPTWDIEMAGSGDLVMTDIRTTSAGLVLPAELDGQIFIRDAEEHLVVELNKPAGRDTELGLAPGAYQIWRRHRGALTRADVSLTQGGRTVLVADAFKSAPMEPTLLRGDVELAEDANAPQMRPVFANFGFLPFMQTNDILGWDVRNHFSFGILGARSGELHGVGIGGLFLWTDRNTLGLQLSGLANFSTELRGGQIGGLVNVARGSVVGLQLGGIGNYAEQSAAYLQIGGIANVTGGQFTGLQIGGVWNSAQDVRGVQLSGVANYAPTASGLQLSVVNVGGNVRGSQIGVVNIASKVSGFQLGVVNVAEDVAGMSLGVVSVVKNGTLALEAYGSDVTLANVALKYGSRHVYTMLALGTGFPSRNATYSAGLGFGIHVPLDRLYVDVDASGHSVFTRDQPWESDMFLSQLRVTAGYRLFSHLAVFGGLTGNVSMRFGAPDLRADDLSPLPSTAWGRTDVWPGAVVGIRI